MNAVPGSGRAHRLAVSHGLALDIPQTEKRLVTIVETNDCFIGGLAAFTGCRVGRRSVVTMVV